MNRQSCALMACAALLAASRLVFADSIDDAEAKRRGVPVAQVIAERQLAAEKAKAAALEKQIADLQKRIADLKAGAGAGETATPAAPAAMAENVPEAPLNFDGPRAPSPLYDDFVSRYLAGDWDKLAADMDAKKKEIAALPAGNAADLAYIAKALAECRPAWWEGVKNGKTTQFRQVVWKQPVLFNYRNGGIAQTNGFSDVNGAFSASIQWPNDEMDANEKLELPEAGLNVPGDFGFKRRDGTDWGIWQVLGNGGALAGAGGADKIKAMSREDKVKLTRYSLFWQNITAGYYGTPAARRLTCAESLASFEPTMNNNANWTGRRPLGAALLLELAANKSHYQGLEIQPILGLEQVGGPTGQMEVFIAQPVMLEFVHNKLTFDQDRRIRELIKTVALANSKWTESQLTLPQDQKYDLDPSKDGPLADARVKAYGSAGGK